MACALPPFVPLIPGQELFQMPCQRHSPLTCTTVPFSHIRAMLPLHDLICPLITLQPHKFPQHFNKIGQSQLELHLSLSLEAFPSDKRRQLHAYAHGLVPTEQDHLPSYSPAAKSKQCFHIPVCWVSFRVSSLGNKFPGELEIFLWPVKQFRLWKLFWIMNSTQ